MDTLPQLLPDYIQTVAIVGGGAWAYWKFIYQRQKEPAANIDIDVRFVGTQDEKWIIEVTCSLENVSLVRHTYRDFRLSVRYLTKQDTIEDGPTKIQYQLNCPRTIDQRLPDNAPGRFFAGVDISANDNGQNYMNPKQRFQHRYVTWIPIEATFVWVQCEFFFELGSGRRQKMNSQKIFGAPGAGPATARDEALPDSVTS